MRNEIVDEIVRAERIAGTLLLTADQNANESIQKTKSSILDAQKKATASHKKLYKDLILEKETEAKKEYEDTLLTCQNECKELKKNCENNVLKVAELLANEVKK